MYIGQDIYTDIDYDINNDIIQSIHMIDLGPSSDWFSGQYKDLYSWWFM